MNHAQSFVLPPRRDRRGIALVITLLLLVLLSAFAVAFFTRMSVEQVSAASYSDGVTTRQLADSAVGLVQSQIREATTVANGAWASQPGMIRTYARRGETGTVAAKDAYAYYKLYSSNDMTLTERGAIDGFDGANEIPQNWARERALFTDLNEPIRFKVANPAAPEATIDLERYPIFDPRFAADSDMSGGNLLSQHNTTRDFKVEGFSIDSRDDTTDNSRGRMPVRWIYVLRDGSLTAPTGSADDGLTAVWEESGARNARVPSATNPVVGRIAFWTDDDTSKVNLNTAGGFTTKDIDAAYDPKGNGNYDLYSGGFWDTPRFWTIFDRGEMTLDESKFGEAKPGETYSLALAQPVTNEFQRYPGHPATTSLGLVFNRTINDGGNITANPRLTSQQLYRLLPRLMPGGTEGGADRLIANNNTAGIYKLTDSRMAMKAERLYASVDEFFFAASQSGNRRQSLNAFMRTPDDSDPRNPIAGLNDDLIGSSDLEEYQGYRFFLTAHSRSPELNLFGRPRITIWPTWASGRQLDGVDYSSRRNPIDRLMMFSSTLGPLPKPTSTGSTADVGNLFMFQRWNPYDPYADANIQRNRDLLQSYLIGTGTRPGLTDQPIPGFTDKESFRTKYNGADAVGSRDQIIAEIFDYIRSGVNLRDTYYAEEVNPARTVYTSLPGGGTVRLALDKQRYAPRGIVVPAAVSFTGSPITRGREVAGFGRFPTVSEVSLVFYHAGYIGSIGAYNNQPYWDPRVKNVRGVKGHLMRMFIMVETNNPMLGYSRTESFANISGADPGRDQRDDRNKTPDRLTHLLALNSMPTIFQDEVSDPQPHVFEYSGGRLTNEVQFYSGSFHGGSNAGGMEGSLHTFGTRFVEPGYNGSTPQYIPPPPPPDPQGDLPSPDTYNDGTGIYPFQSLNAVYVPFIPGTPPSASNPNPTIARPQINCRFSGLDATLFIRWGSLDLQTIRLNFPPIPSMPIPTDAFWEDPGGFGWKMAAGEILNGDQTYRTSWVSDRSEQNWPWGCELLNYPAAMKSLAHRIWWVNGTFFNYDGRQRADSDRIGKYDSTGAEIFDSRPRGYRFDNRWRNIIQPGDVVRSLVPAPADNTDIRTTALMRTKTNEVVSFAPLKSYAEPFYLRHVQKLLSPNPGERERDVTADLPNNTTASRQTQLLRSGSGAAFIFSAGTTAAHLANPGPSPGQATVTGCSLEPTMIQVPNSPPQYRWVRKSYGSVGGGVSFGNLVELPGVAKAGDYTTAAADLPALQQSGSNQMLNGIRRTNRSTAGGDFDTGFGARPDGSYLNKPDEGHFVWRTGKSLPSSRTPDPKVSNEWNYLFPYFNGDFNDEGSDTFWSPARQLPSPVHFGSLLAGPKTSWQTLCFSPNPMGLSGSGADHPGMDVEPKDHLLLDLFQMPVVEPYAITEPFSTAGKVNLNCEIMPFTYIQRTTALRAALHPIRITAVNPDQVRYYKGQDGASTRRAISEKQNYRLLINRDETIKGITAIFSDINRPVSERFYKSASQICERFLYPTHANYVSAAPGPKWNRSESQIRNFWRSNTLGGDNTREKPYADLYPRLTTKSNTYTVHVRVQKLRPQRGQVESDFLRWKDTGESVTAEYRGEVQIERYLDPQDRRFDLQDRTINADEKFDVNATVYRPTQTNTRPLEFAYRFRTLNTKRFSPDR